MLTSHFSSVQHQVGSASKTRIRGREMAAVLFQQFGGRGALWSPLLGRVRERKGWGEGGRDGGFRGHDNMA